MTYKFDEIRDIIEKIKSFLYKKLGKNISTTVEIWLWDNDGYRIIVFSNRGDFLHQVRYEHKRCTYERQNKDDLKKRELACSAQPIRVEIEDINLY